MWIHFFVDTMSTNPWNWPNCRFLAPSLPATWCRLKWWQTQGSQPCPLPKIVFGGWLGGSSSWTWWVLWIIVECVCWFFLLQQQLYCQCILTCNPDLQTLFWSCARRCCRIRCNPLVANCSSSFPNVLQSCTICFIVVWDECDNTQCSNQLLLRISLAQIPWAGSVRATEDTSSAWPAYSAGGSLLQNWSNRPSLESKEEGATHSECRFGKRTPISTRHITSALKNGRMEFRTRYGFKW